MYLRLPLLLIVAIAIIVPINFAAAFGVSPPFVRADKLVPGASFEQTITLVQGQPVADLGIKAEFDVPEKIRPWLSIDKGEHFVIPKGTQQFPISVRINVPKDAALGIYNGYLRVNTVPVRTEGSQINISVGARIDLSLKVGDEAFIDFEIKKMDILDIHEGGRPKIEVTMQNKGNVAVALSRATFELFDKFGDIRLGFAETAEMPEIPPFKTETFVVEFPLNMSLGIGEYWANAAVYYNGAISRDLKTVFDVTEKKYNLLALVGGGSIGLFLVGAVALLIRRRFHNQHNS